MKKEIIRSPELPFADKEIYYSGSISGVEENDVNFPISIVDYLQRLGAKVPNSYVALTLRHAPVAFLAGMMAYQEAKWDEWMKLTDEEQAECIYTRDVEGVLQADYCIMVLNGPSHGVGIELAEAITMRKRDLKVNGKTILGLVYKQNYGLLSPMVKGAAVHHKSIFTLEQYDSLETAQAIIYSFLTQLPDPVVPSWFQMC